MVGRSEWQVEVVGQVDRRADISDGHGGARGRLIGHGEVGRNRQVSGNGGMDGQKQLGDQRRCINVERQAEGRENAKE